jgi:Flp pilus assembly pilin Flp
MGDMIRRWMRAAQLLWQDGQGLAEYAILITLVAVASIAIMAVLGSTVFSLYSYASAEFPR